ncbi:MAG: alanine-glyoxylate transaminase / serine-glyoxylate transaminase / serine-pyruvate transaminase [Solirubrobacteraceae bacterium]|jgi:alanine-glyoxylate transaminase/serine-glyoxylate transaminase/serine-pyruvate transaminase|nr:alanine-glyoxylate transaminase / serine-glyoxylate transaminase / serine-pyruvate transaminase [Solirubrobacteraceae bacterium]
MTTTETVTSIPWRLLLGSGPSPVPERVLHALAQPTIGHMDPAFAEIMGETISLLREAFQTENAATLPISGTGSAGMEALVANFVDPGDRVVCGVNGLFGERMADELARSGAEVVRVEAEWGRAIDPELLIAAAADGLDAMVVVHGETSTGVAQPLEGLADACHERDALFMIDCVTSLGGHPLRIDEAGVDAAFSGTQKCLNCPPGLAPLTANERALAKLAKREKPGHSWYLDLSLVLSYWNPPVPGLVTDNDAPPLRAYHHTAPINMIYALREALRIVVADEWLPTTWERHRRAHHALRDALAVFGCERLARDGEQLHPLLAVSPPEGVDEAAIRKALLLDHGIEISGGLGPLTGRLWRIGIMGAGARREPQEQLVGALATLLKADPAEPLAALAEGWRA